MWQSMRIVGFGTYDRRKHPRAGILLDGLGELGATVTELNAPLGFSTAERVEMLGKPWLAYRFAARILRRWAELTRARLSVRGRVDAVVVGYLGHFDVVVARLLFPRTPIALDLLIFAADTARDRGVRSGLKLRLLDTLDRIAVACSTVVVLDTDEHRELLPPSQRHKAIVAPVGAPADWFAAPSPDDGELNAPLRVVFYGLFTPLQGAPTIGRALALLPAGSPVHVTMVGGGQDLDETVAAAGSDASVTWIDWMEPEELTALVASQDVCLGIFGTTSKALRVTPNKVYQGAAAGCAIVTSDTAPQRRALGAAAVYVEPGNPEALAGALAELAGDRGEVSRLRQAAHERAEAAFRPAAVAHPLLEALISLP